MECAGAVACRFFETRFFFHAALEKELTASSVTLNFFSITRGLGVGDENTDSASLGVDLKYAFRGEFYALVLGGVIGCWSILIIRFGISTRVFGL